MKALIARSAGAEPAVEDIPSWELGPGEVRVRVRAAGVCHSDLSMINGTLSPTFPLVLGHEAAGTAIAVGAGVNRVRAGDRVVLNWSPACRECWYCRRGETWLCTTSGSPSSERGPFHVTLGLGALAEEVVVPEGAAVPVPAEIDFDLAALLGCAALTGIGAVQRTAGVRAGDSVAVVGLGGVGLAAVIAARAAGADPVIAVDVTPAKSALALAAGATHFVPSDDGTVRAIRGLTGGRGVDHALECVGRSGTIATAWRCTRRGGHVTVVGMGARDDMVSLSALDIFHSARTLRSSVYGSSDPDVAVPELAREVIDRRLDLSPLVTHRITLDEAPAALARMARGEGARSIVLF